MNNRNSISSLARKVVAAGAAVTLGTLSLAGLGPIGAASAATVVFDLCATSGSSAAFPTGTTATTAVSFWGYAAVDAAGCLGATVTKPGGPVLTVNQGDTVTIHLHNNLTEATSLDIGGAALPSDTAGTDQSTSKDYTFTASEPGTFIYQAGLTAHGPQEVALGLYGALVVRPAAANQAYGDSGSAYDAEQVLVLSELDPALTPSTYTTFDMRDFAPKWGLINGQPFSTMTTAPVIPAAAGDDVLVRYVNAGSLYHSMSVLGANQTQLATDGHRLPADRHFVAETFGPGQTADVLVHVPAGSTPGTKLTLFEGNTSLFNKDKKTNSSSSKAFGGMMAFITVGTSTGTTGGPFANSMAFTGGVLTATIDDTTTGGDNVDAAEYFVDSVGATGTGTAMTAVDGTFDTPTEAVTSGPTPISLSPGLHVVFLRGRDLAGNWGPLANLPVVIGPSTTNVAFTAGNLTATMTANGGDTVAAAEYFVDSVGASGAGAAMTATDGAFDAATEDVTATPALTPGAHTLYLHGKDSTGNWGSIVSKVVQVTAADTAGPATSAASLSPALINPTPATVTVAVHATADDTATGGGTIAGGELFVDTAGADGTGTVMTANAAAPVASIDGTIGNSALAALSEGSHQVLIHAQDAAGNWGPTTSVALVIDRTGPSTTGVSISPNPNNGTVPVNTSTAAVRVSGITSDVAANGGTVVAAELFLCSALDSGANPGCPAGALGTGATMIVSDGAWDEPAESVYGDIPLATVNTLTNGNHTIWVRGRDAAGNWGPAVSATLLIDRAAPTFTGVTVSPTQVLVPPGTTALTVNGAADTGGAGVAGGEYWFGNTAPAAGAGTQFTGTANVPLNLSALAPGNYTLNVRIRDAAFNWSTGTGGIRSTTLTVAPDAIFANGFDTGNRPWGWTSASVNNANAARLNVTTTSPLVGTRSLLAQGSNTNYVQFTYGTGNPAWATFDGAFSFRPPSVGGVTATGQDILSAATAGNFNTQVFRVLYRRSGTQDQVQIRIGTTANANWVNISNAAHRIEVTWQSGTLTLYVDGVSSQTLTGTAGNVGAVRLGAVTSGGAAATGNLVFDAFSAKRSTSTLIGPA